MKKIKIGSDFSGVGAFNQALLRLEIPYKELFACDMDKYARQTFELNYGAPKYFPKDVYDREIPKESLDIYMTSPPCQSFSLAGKRLGKEDKRGILFFNSLEFIQENKPRYFIFENVKGLLSHDKVDAKATYGRTFQEWINYLGGGSVNGVHTFFPIEDSVPYHIYFQVLNAKHYGIPQNRERVFIIGIRDDDDNNFQFPKPLPLEKRLKDVLESEVDEKYFLSDKMLELITYNKKGSTEIANINKGGQKGSVVSQNGTHIVCLSATDYKLPKFVEVNADNSNFISCLTATDYKQPKQISVGFVNQDTQASKIFSEQGTSPSICAGTHGYANGYVETKIGTWRTHEDGKGFRATEDNNCPTIPATAREDGSGQPVIKIGEIRGRNPDNPKSRKSGLETEQMLEINENGTSNALTTVQKDNVVVIRTNNSKGFDTAEEEEEDSINFSNPNSETRRGRVGKKVSQTLDTACNQGIFTQQRIRRLTPLECFKLMDFNFGIPNVPDFKWDVSDSQAYKQAGNSICVGVLAAIIEKLKLK
jgi:DNA-cytosine methyltransferase